MKNLAVLMLLSFSVSSMAKVIRNPRVESHFTNTYSMKVGIKCRSDADAVCRSQGFSKAIGQVECKIVKGSSSIGRFLNDLPVRLGLTNVYSQYGGIDTITSSMVLLNEIPEGFELTKRSKGHEPSSETYQYDKKTDESANAFNGRLDPRGFFMLGPIVPQEFQDDPTAHPGYFEKNLVSRIECL